MPEHIKCQMRERCINYALQYHREHGEKTSSQTIIATASQFYNFVFSQEWTPSPKAVDTDVT